MSKVNKIIFSVIGLLLLAIGTGVVFSALNKDPIYSVMDKEDAVSAASTTYTTTEKGNFDPYALNWLDGSWADEAVGLEHYIDYLNKFNSNEEVIVAVIDSGICTQNPLFKDRIVKVKETMTIEMGYTDPATNDFVQTDKETFEVNDLLGYAMKGNRTDAEGKNVVERNIKFNSTIDYSKSPYNVNPNIPSDYKPYPFEDDKPNGHGTAVASMIASLTPKNVKILPIKRGYGYETATNGNINVKDHLCYGAFDLIKKLKHDYGYNIVAVNMSLSLGEAIKTNNDNDPLQAGVQSIQDVLQRHIKILKEDYDILTCVAAGNKYERVESQNLAGIDEALVCGMIRKLDDGSYIRVSNDESPDKPGNYGTSGYGFTLDFMAPGWQVKIADYRGPNKNGTNDEWLKTTTFEDARWGQGASFATPCVSALVALLACDENYYDIEGKPVEGIAYKIEERLRKSAIDGLVDEKDYSGVEDKYKVYDAPGCDEYYGYGMANLSKHQIEINYETEDVEVSYDGDYHNIELQPYVDCEILYSLTENGEYNITDITKVDAFKNATQGKKPIYFKLQAKDDVNNYYFKETKGVAYLTINPIELDAVTLIDQTIAYGGLDELDHTQYEITNGAVLSGDEGDLYIGSNAKNTTGIGEYELFVASRSGNYKINSNKKKLTIVKRDVTIQLGTTSSNYGSAINLDNYTYEVVSGEVKNEEFLKLNLTTNADSTSVVGSYELNGINLDDNYNVTIIKGEHIVTPKQVVIQLKESTTWYLGWFNKRGVKWEVVSGNIKEGDDLDLEILSNVDSKKLGQYESWAISHNPNYEVIVQKGIVNVKVTDTQLLFFVVIGIMIFVAIMIGVTIMVRVKTRKRRLKKAAKNERQSLVIANKTH